MSLNLLAGCGAALGVANILLAWRLFGTSREGDLWMMAMAVAQTLAVLSQLGVEQVTVFSARARAAGSDSGRQFDRTSLQWALLFGLTFAALAGAMLQGVAKLFAPGFDADLNVRLMSVLLPILLQLAAAPALFVLRQQLLLDDRPAWSMVLSHAYGVVQCLVLAGAVAGGFGQLEALAGWVGAGSLAVVLAAIGCFGPRGTWRWHTPEWPALAVFVRASMAMRLTHSMHNLLVVAVTNAALSTGPAGTVAVFQYAKRLVDGLATVAVSPHMAVLHAKQATAWMQRDAAAFCGHAVHYIRTAVPLLVGASTLALLASWAWASLSDQPPLRPGGSHWLLLLLLCAWQLVMAVETVAAGVLSYDNRAGSMFAVNSLYIACFFGVVQLLPVLTGGVAVVAAALGCQLLSLVLFTWLASGVHRQRFDAPRFA